MSILRGRELRAERTGDRDVAGNTEGQELIRAYFSSSVSTWSEVYDEKDLYRRIYKRRMDAVLEMLDRLALPPHSRILEIGCGPGVMTVALAQRGYRVTAVDFVFEMSEATARLTIGAGVDPFVTTSVGDVHQLPFSDNRFDLVLVVGVIEWLPGLCRPLREIARVTKQGGFTIVTTDNRWALHALLDPLRNPVLGPAKRKFLNLLHRAGFGVRHVRPNTYSILEFDCAVRGAGLKKLARKTLGFGPFSFFRQLVMPDSIGLRLDQILQHLADRSFPIIKSAGHVYLLFATKLSRGERGD